MTIDSGYIEKKVKLFEHFRSLRSVSRQLHKICTQYTEE